MILSKSPTFCLLVAVLACAGLRAETVDLGKAVQSLIDAEQGYNKLAQEKNFAAASVQVFADDGVAFAPGPVNGKKLWSTETDPPILTWRPIFATISRSGDLGYTTGPWELRKAKEWPPLKEAGGNAVAGRHFWMYFRGKHILRHCTSK